MSKASLYLISPPQFDLEHFASQLEIALSVTQIPMFQLRLKELPQAVVVNAAKRLMKICHKYHTKFILNDNLDLALQIGANGVHLGAQDKSIADSRVKVPQDFIIGASCYDSKESALSAWEQGAGYLSFGTFFPSRTKNSIGKPTTKILQWCRHTINLPVVAIGGINDQNCLPLIAAGANYLAVISYIWQNEQGIEYAVNSLIQKIIAHPI